MELSNKPIKLYQDNGYVNYKGIFETGYPFILILSGRGPGKTVNCLKYHTENNDRYILLRRTATIVDTLKDPSMSPLNRMNELWPELSSTLEKTEIGANIIRDSTKEQVGLFMPLSTFSKARGFSAESYTVQIYDEVVPQLDERPLKGEYTKWYQSYETVNRNREIEDPPRPPLRTIFLGNLDNIVAPMLVGLNVCREIYEMQKKDIEQLYLPERNLAIFLLLHSPIVKEKAKKQAINKLTGNSRDHDVNVKMNWVFDDTLIERKDLKGYVFKAGFGGINVYRHKGTKEYYVTERKIKDGETYEIKDRELTIFRREYRHLIDSYYDGDIRFSDPLNLALFLSYFNLKM